MPIGKNAIKRVSNSGYSNVQTSAPDMENSTIAKAEEAPKTEAPKTEAPKVDAPKAQAPKIEAPATTPEVAPKKTAPKKTAKKPVKKSEPTKQGFVHLAIGDDLPYYLL